MAELSFDSQLITPKNSIIKTLDLLLPPEDIHPVRSISQEGAMLFPVIGKTLFSPGLLTCFIQNVFPIAFTIEDACSIRGLESPPLGHALHDIGHAFLVINTKREKFKNDFKEICKDLPFNNVDDSKLFKKQLLQFLLTKNRAYETALAQTIAHFETQDNKEYLKKVLTGLFFANLIWNALANKIGSIV